MLFPYHEKCLANSRILTKFILWASANPLYGIRNVKFIVFDFLADCPIVTDLGLSDESISDSQITASTDYDHSPAAGVKLDPTGSAWRSKSTDGNPWLQVDFQEVVNIAIIKTQGVEETQSSFIRTFSISFGNDGTNFEDYQHAGRKKVLDEDMGKPFYQSCWTNFQFIIFEELRSHLSCGDTHALLLAIFFGNREQKLKSFVWLPTIARSDSLNLISFRQMILTN